MVPAGTAAQDSPTTDRGSYVRGPYRQRPGRRGVHNLPTIPIPWRSKTRGRAAANESKAGSTRAKPDDAPRAPVTASREVALQGGTRVPLEEGDGQRWIYQVVEGLLRVVAIGVDGQEFGLGWLGAGEVLTSGGSAEEGAPAMYLEAVRPARYIGFRVEAVAADPELAIRLVVPLAQRVADLSATAASLTLEAAAQRLLHVLRQVAVRHGVRDGQGWKVRIRQQDLGLLAGLCRETVNTVLRDLALQGRVRCGRARVWLIDEPNTRERYSP